MSYIKAKWEELEIGKTFYSEIWDCVTHTPSYRKVQVIDLTDRKVTYKYENGWKEYIYKSQWTELYLYKEDPQLTLF